MAKLLPAFHPPTIAHEAAAPPAPPNTPKQYVKELRNLLMEHPQKKGLSAASGSIPGPETESKDSDPQKPKARESMVDYKTANELNMITRSWRTLESPSNSGDKYEGYLFVNRRRHGM
ncbi:hypothetical protein ACJ73_05501 [Blastomyces percursus]|uniref:Uncharacterized protein n=1 Tax=Blastomyces percursus TaxID=1658174 RepID=A0A1J9R685_9EURO|nr:hypothetical protein ACJ73_05501 [Blastomyces percursus]